MEREKKGEREGGQTEQRRNNNIRVEKVSRRRNEKGRKSFI